MASYDDNGILLKKFSDMVWAHDLTYSYSDDGAVWRRGQAAYDKIRETAKALPIEDVEKIWNQVVDHKLSPDARKSFYWRDPERQS
jgi:hypothetical protein